MTDERYDVLIVGAGHGGAAAAIALRQLKFAGTIALAGDEPVPPYERPPLSKEYLAGARAFERMLIRPLAFWGERQVTLRPGMRVVGIDADAHVATAADGRRIGYGTLILATGGAPRQLACDGGTLAGVHAIRTVADVDRLRAELPAVTRAVVIGGGYIGLEAAAALRAAGKAVTVVEAQPRVLARVAGAALSDFYAAEHRRQGVDLRLDTAVACIEGEARAIGVRLADGELLPAELVVVGIGIEPAVAPLIAAGADTAQGAGGVAVDALCRTSLPDTYAIGDCAAQANAHAEGAVIRVESVQNAVDQAGTVARAIVGQPSPHAALPWFWSNQYDLKLQTVGLSRGHDLAILRGDPATRAFSVVYLRDGAVIALDCVNRTADYAAGRALVTARARIAPERLADAATPLKTLV